ncbi:VCBS repeat-containing protein [Flavobacterium sp. CYK-55]|uniref:FG-GAP-like repeat-containing protein n=1 Tax=Flavobacterium sp. CYK-55 TaxID=2835529 RepID=UPI001BD13E01|nr:FG-GAP-like repeat-containing protein [Flavobacterium sp. CYK-55]MBS7787070.1 VCBS repeat-containing protein [Flavobacterium sp. CYK-55]
MKKKDCIFKMISYLIVLLMGPFLGIGQIFTKVTNGAIVSSPADSRSVNWVDVNNDGWLDLFISNGKAGGQNNMLYLNQGNGNFLAVDNDPIVLDSKPSDGATFADCDNDGDLDAYVVNWYNEDNLFYLNDGSGHFTEVIGTVSDTNGYCETAAWGDYDNDGQLDLYVTKSGPSVGTRRNQLYHNDGGATFTKILTGDMVTNSYTSRCINWTDIDLDGLPDIFVTNEGTSNTNENLYHNDGAGNFTRITTGDLLNDGGKTMSSSWADYDNDGDLDVYLTNDGSNNVLFRNDGNLIFTKMASDPVSNTNSHSFSSAWSDIDNDGDLDLFVTNSYNPTPELLHNFLYLNNGDGTFTQNFSELPATDASWSYGCAFGDYDNDGFEDLAVATVAFNGVDAPDFLYHNTPNNNHWITIKLVGRFTNKSAIGTRIHIKATINGVSVWQMREISAQSSYCGQNDLRAHFGLGDATTIDEIKIEWPSSIEETILSVAGNQFITIVEGQGILGVNQTKHSDDFFLYPNPVKSVLNIIWADKSPIVSTDIYNTLGQLVLTIPSAQQTKTVDVSSLKTGNYVVKINSEKGSSSAKFVKI